MENDIKEQERQIELSKKNVDYNNKEARTLVRKLEERQKILYDLLVSYSKNVTECPKHH